METTYKCKNDKVKEVHHWFGESGSEDSSEDDFEDSTNEDWSTVEREKSAKKREGEEGIEIM